MAAQFARADLAVVDLLALLLFLLLFGLAMDMGISTRTHVRDRSQHMESRPDYRELRAQKRGGQCVGYPQKRRVHGYKEHRIRD